MAPHQWGLPKPSCAPRAAKAQSKAERGAQNRVNTFVFLENRPALKDISASRRTALRETSIVLPVPR